MHRPAVSGVDASRLLPDIGRLSRLRPRLLLAVAGFVYISSIIGALPPTYGLPLIGLLTAWSANADTRPDARAVAASSRNLLIGSLVLVAGVVVVFQAQLERLTIVLFGMDLPSGILTSLSVGLLALPLALTESEGQIADVPSERLVSSKRNVILTSTVVVTVATWHATVGLSFVVLAVLIVGLPLVLAASRLLQHRQGSVETGFWRHPLRPRWKTHTLQLFNIILFAGLVGLAELAGTFDIVRLYLSSGGFQLFQVAFVTGLVTLVILALVPLSHVYLGTNVAVAVGSSFLALQLLMTVQPPAEAVEIASPLGEEWYVSQGGHAELVNYHYVTTAQRDAVDIVQIIDGHTHTPESSTLDSYHIFGATLLAPATGVVTDVVDGFEDQPIGSVDGKHQAGNHLVIDITGGRYLLLAHLREGSIQVTIGDRVIAGQAIAEVGNSGNTTEPHIHIQAYNLPTFEPADEDLVELLRTARTYPLLIRDAVLIRNGSMSSQGLVDPRRGDIVRPAS